MYQNKCSKWKQTKQATIHHAVLPTSLAGCARRPKVRTESLAVLKSICFLAHLEIRVQVARSLGGVDGMLTLVRDPIQSVALQVSRLHQQLGRLATLIPPDATDRR